MGAVKQWAMEQGLLNTDDSGYDAYAAQQAEAKAAIELLAVDAVSAIRRLSAAALHDPELATSEQADVVAAVRELELTIGGTNGKS